MALSSIQWCMYTFNAWLGCRKVAPECANCYIVGTPTFRFRKLTHGPTRIRTMPSTWAQPLAWNRKADRDLGACEVGQEPERPRVFCLSLGDWLDDENVPIEWTADLLKLIHDTPNLDWLLLTKRPQNWPQRIEAALDYHFDHGDRDVAGWLYDWRKNAIPPRNVWIGVSAGADQWAALLIPARVHFLSCEPMLRPLDTEHAVLFDWIIFGGESGKKARTLDIKWIRDGLTFCRINGVKAFVKQLGAKPIMSDPYLEVIRNGQKSPLPLELKDSHGGDMDEWPEDLRVREFPSPR